MKHCFTLSGNNKLNLTSIVIGAAALHETTPRQTIYEFYGTVGTNLHAIRQRADVRPHVYRQTFQGQQKLMLPRLEASLACGLLAEMQEAANLVAEFRERWIVRQCGSRQYVG
jgi:hypothetical protein